MPSGKKVYRIWSVSEARRRTKAKAVEYKGGKCEVCGYSKSQAAMDFHHVDPTQKDLAIGSGNPRQWEVIRVELDKCRLLCSNCHREEHDRLRQEHRTEQARAAREEVSERKDQEQRSCTRCGELVGVTPSRIMASLTGALYCGLACFRASRETTGWPGDDVLRGLVWQVPVQQIGRQLGVSASAVKKRCRVRGIPTPPRGYWSSRHKVTPLTPKW